MVNYANIIKELQDARGKFEHIKAAMPQDQSGASRTAAGVGDSITGVGTGLMMSGNPLGVVGGAITTGIGAITSGIANIFAGNKQQEFQDKMSHWNNQYSDAYADINKIENRAYDAKASMQNDAASAIMNQGVSNLANNGVDIANNSYTKGIHAINDALNNAKGGTNNGKNA